MATSLPKNRAEARRAGSPDYFTGKPCARGHISRRKTSNANCVECLAERLNDWRSRNPEKARAQALRYRNADPERVNKRTRQWRIENPEWDRKYYAKNKDRILKVSAEWKSNNPEKRAVQWRNRRARVAEAEGTHSAHDVQLIFQSQKGLCAGCGCDISESYHVDHIMPISKGGSNWPDNLQCLCAHCNLTKHAKLPEQWLMEIQQNGD